MQKGFATIFGLCVILVFALIIKGVAAVEENHAYETRYFQAEVELQNAAISGVYRAVEQVVSGEVTLTKVKNYSLPNARKDNQRKFPIITKQSEHFGKITVETWGEWMEIQPYKVNYGYNNTANTNGSAKNAYVFFSRASADANFMSGKIYNRAFACVFTDEDGNIDEGATINFLEETMSTYKFKN